MSSLLVAGAAKAAEPVFETAGSQLRISDLGPNPDTPAPNQDAQDPAVAFNNSDNSYLVVWSSDVKVDGEFEIYGRRMSPNGSPLSGQFRISNMGPDGNTNFDAVNPAVTFNSETSEFLVVWSADDNSGSLTDDENEIYGQIITSNGNPAGPDDFRISDMGPDGNASYDAVNPDVAYNLSSHSYMVVWSGDDSNAPLVDNENEIFGQMLNMSANQVGSNDFRLSDMGTDGSTSFAAEDPAVVADTSPGGKFLTVWSGDDNSGALVDNEFEIFGQLTDGFGAATGANDFRISNMGPDGDVAYQAVDPAVARNSSSGHYMVVWSGDNNLAGNANDYFQIFGRTLQGNGSFESPGSAALISNGPAGDTNFGLATPRIIYAASSNAYLVVASGDDNISPLVNDETEIFGRLIGLNNAPLSQRFVISSVGPTGNANFDAGAPAIAYNNGAGSGSGSALTVFDGDDDQAPYADNEKQIYSRQVAPKNTQVQPPVQPPVDPPAEPPVDQPPVDQPPADGQVQLTVDTSKSLNETDLTKAGGIGISVSGVQAGATITISGKVKVSKPKKTLKLKSRSVVIAAGTSYSGKLKLTKKQLRIVKRALRRKARVTAYMTIKMVTADGTSASSSIKIKLKRSKSKKKKR